MRERALLQDSNVKGYVCNACGWAWPTPRFVPSNKSPEQSLRTDFDEHNCAEYPMTPGKELERDAACEQEELRRREDTYQADIEAFLNQTTGLTVAEAVKKVLNS